MKTVWTATSTVSGRSSVGLVGTRAHAATGRVTGQGFIRTLQTIYERLSKHTKQIRFRYAEQGQGG